MLWWELQLREPSSSISLGSQRNPLINTLLPIYPMPVLFHGKLCRTGESEQWIDTDTASKPFYNKNHKRKKKPQVKIWASSYIFRHIQLRLNSIFKVYYKNNLNVENYSNVQVNIILYFWNNWKLLTLNL